MSTQDIVQKLWNLCHVLRDDGVTYHQYVTELTYILFLKMAKETGTESQLPKGYRWDDLAKKDGVELLEFYKILLVHLGSHGSPRVQAIYANASTTFRQPRNLQTVVQAIDALDWYSAKTEGLGDLYEGLLEKNAEETKSGAGQYFTPRPLIESMVHVIKPKAGEMVQDPAVGTGGFLIVADRYVKDETDQLFKLPEQQQLFQRKQAFYGMELVPDVQRLALMNAMLHDIEGDVLLGDALGPSGAALPKADVILSNPPFGTKKGGGGVSALKHSRSEPSHVCAQNALHEPVKPQRLHEHSIGFTVRACLAPQPVAPRRTGIGSSRSPRLRRATSRTRRRTRRATRSP